MALVDIVGQTGATGWQGQEGEVALVFLHLRSTTNLHRRVYFGVIKSHRRSGREKETLRTGDLY